MKPRFRTRSTCRLCDSSEIVQVFSFSPSQPVDGFRPHGHPYLALPRFPMDLYICSDCGHVQLLDVVNPEVLYGDYIYTSSSSPDLENHFNSYFQYLSERIDLTSSNILDVGCNDGLFLKYFKTTNSTLFGIDPAPNIASHALATCDYFVGGYCDTESISTLFELSGNTSFDLVTANNVFAHSDDLSNTLEVISSSLRDEGYFCFEVSYLLDLIESRIIDYVYHEHLSYHSIRSLLPFLNNRGLSIVDIQRVPTKGGSIRVLCQKLSTTNNSPVANQYIESEYKAGCYSLNAYRDLSSQVANIKTTLSTLINDFSSLPLISYGAAPSSVVNALLLSYEDKLSCYIDDNPLRQNLISPNVSVPVFASNFLSDVGDCVVIIGAWRFADLIIPKIKRLNPNAVIIVPNLTTGVTVHN